MALTHAAGKAGMPLQGAQNILRRSMGGGALMARGAEANQAKTLLDTYSRYALPGVAGGMAAGGLAGGAASYMVPD